MGCLGLVGKLQRNVRVYTTMYVGVRIYVCVPVCVVSPNESWANGLRPFFTPSTFTSDARSLNFFLELRS